MRKNLGNLVLIMAMLLSTFAMSQPFVPPVCSPASNQLANPQITTATGKADMAAGVQYEIGFRFQDAGDDPVPASTLRIIVSIDDSKLQWGNPILSGGCGVWQLSTDPNEIQSDAIVLYNTGGATADGLGCDIKLNIVPKIVGVSQFNTSVNRLSASCVGDTDPSAANNGKAATLTTITPLPVKLLSFTAIKEGLTAVLKWSTTEETNSDRFEIERSQNGRSWDFIGSQKSNGESITLKSYSFSDAKPLKGENLYRLKMIDRDATFAYSRIQSLTFASDLTTSFYPNPIGEKLIIQTSDFSLVKSVKIFDANGRTVYQSSATPSSEINVQNLSTGLYIVQMTSKSGAVISHKVIKQ